MVKINDCSVSLSPSIQCQMISNEIQYCIVILLWLCFYTDVSITVSRQYGTYGDVEVFYRTLRPNETNLPFLPSVQARADSSDFRHTEGSIIFSQGQSSASFNVLVMDDNIPETDESVFVTLSRVQLLRPAQRRPCMYSH